MTTEIAQQPTAQVSPDIDRPLTKKQLADWFGKTPRTVERYMGMGMPYIKIGAPMFHLPSVKAWLMKNQVGSV
jgi:hypothetical protein